MRLLVLLPVAVLAGWSALQGPDRDWPAVTRETRPWSRWWWHGSAVDRAPLTADLASLRAAGIGGVEITPIYGVRGEDAQFIPFLSDGWVDMLTHSSSTSAGSTTARACV